MPSLQHGFMLSHIWLFVIPWTVAPRLLGPWSIPTKNTGVGCHFLLQGIFAIHRWNPRLLSLLHCQSNSLPFCHGGSLAYTIDPHWIYIQYVFYYFENSQIFQHFFVSISTTHKSFLYTWTYTLLCLHEGFIYITFM